MRFYLVIFFLLISYTASAWQVEYFKEKEKTKKELRKEKRASKRKARAEKQAVGIELLESRDFVLMASTINGPDGFTVPVRETTNFVRIDSSRVTVQYGVSGKSAGANGLGGFTFEGRIQSFGVNDAGENKTYNAVIYFTTPQNPHIMSVHIYIWGDKAQARFFNGDRNVTFDGKYAKGSEAKLWEASVKNANVP